MTYDIARTTDFDACLALRMAVFVQEQGVPQEIENDQYDAGAIHLLATRDGVAMGTARIVKQGDTGKIGRVCVVRAARGTGLGALIMAAALDEMRQDPDMTKAVLGAQLSALGFYEKLGFVAEGDEFIDGGLPHRMMRRVL